MTDRTVNTLLDERARLVAKNAATSGHLWAAEHYLARLVALLPRLTAELVEDCEERDDLIVSVLSFLNEDREHPGLPDEAGDALGEGGDPVSSGDDL
jgi:hypothetical protein